MGPNVPNSAFVHLGFAEGGSEKADRPHNVRIIGNYFHMGPPSYQGWADKYAAYIHVAAGWAVIIDQNEFLGGKQASDHPVCRLTAQATACIAHFAAVSDAEGRDIAEGTLGLIVLDSGVGNYGSWWDPSLNLYKKWNPLKWPS